MNPVVIKVGDVVVVKDSPYDSIKNGDLLTIDCISHDTYYLSNGSELFAPFYKNEFEVVQNASN